MQINVSGKGVEVGESMIGYAEGKLEEGIGKYSDRVNGVNAVISREAHLFRVDITGNVGTHEGLVIRAGAAANDVYAAFDQASAKIEKQLRRYKRRLTRHHTEKVGLPEASVTPIRGIKYVIADHDESDEKDAPLVIAEKTTEIEHLTVSQAVMRMDFNDLPALMFINTASGRYNVVYRRHDGNVSWVDSAAESAAAA